MLSSIQKILKTTSTRQKNTSGSCSRSQTEQTAHSYIDTFILKNNTNISTLLWKFRQNALFSPSTKQIFAVYILTQISCECWYCSFINLLNSQSVFPARGLGKERTVPRSSKESLKKPLQTSVPEQEQIYPQEWMFEELLGKP